MEGGREQAPHVVNRSSESDRSWTKKVLDDIGTAQAGGTDSAMAALCRPRIVINKVAPAGMPRLQQSPAAASLRPLSQNVGSPIDATGFSTARPCLDA
ncbi:hypothetical protein MRX96_010672 [Rhipicephalus microplus]